MKYITYKKFLSFVCHGPVGRLRYALYRKVKGAVRLFCLLREAMQAHDFTACEIIKITLYNNLLSIHVKMAERICKVSRKKQGLGRPRESREGWASVNKWIYLSNNTFNKWGQTRFGK